MSFVALARADLLGTQLATAFRLVLSRSVPRSLRHSFCNYSHRIRRLRQRSGGPNCPRHIASRSARPDGLLAHFLVDAFVLTSPAYSIDLTTLYNVSRSRTPSTPLDASSLPLGSRGAVSRRCVRPAGSLYVPNGRLRCLVLPDCVLACLGSFRPCWVSNPQPSTPAVFDVF